MKREKNSGIVITSRPDKADLVRKHCFECLITPWQAVIVLLLYRDIYIIEHTNKDTLAQIFLTYSVKLVLYRIILLVV